MDSAAGRHIDDLPDEIFAWILNLVPIEQVIRCAIVSKRWDAACRFIIRTRESLIIENGSGCLHDASKERGWVWNRERPSQQMDGITLVDNLLISAMMISLNQMTELRRLCFETCDVSPADIIPFISPFIRKFADQLTMLEVDFEVSMIGADAFPHLTRLQCRHFDANSSAAFPKLAELIVCGMKKDEKLSRSCGCPWNFKKLIIMPLILGTRSSVMRIPSGIMLKL